MFSFYSQNNFVQRTGEIIFHKRESFGPESGDLTPVKGPSGDKVLPAGSQAPPAGPLLIASGPAGLLGIKSPENRPSFLYITTVL